MSTRERKRRFDALFASYGSDIVAYCSWRSASTSDAQDAAADVFLIAWRRLDEVPEGDAAKVWLYVGGTTLRRLAGSVTGMTVSRPGNGSTVYRGQLAAGAIARETGFKEGEAIRVLPFGYVAHDEAANASALLDVAVTVGADGVVRQISVSWGTWDYTVAYGSLGSAPALEAPKNARDLVKERLRAVGRG